MNKNTWNKLLENWTCVMDKYIKKGGGDLPFWHAERANTGFLAAAAWKIGAVAIEEYYTERKDERKKVSKGRCDLWVRFKNGTSFSAEAKQLWPSYDAVRTIEKRIIAELNNADKQLKTIKDKGENDRLVSICFVSPRKWKEYNKDKVEVFRKHVEATFNGKNTKTVSYFPENKLAQNEAKDGYNYPGVILIARFYK